MIEQVIPTTGGRGLALRLTPNRSAGSRGLLGAFAAIATVAMGVAWLAAANGNVFAPAFAVLDVALVGIGFRCVGRALAREETIAFFEDAVVVRRGTREDARFQTYWLRVEDEPGATPNARHRLLLGSHGRRVEVGAFLADDERAELARRIKDALATVRGAAPVGTTKG